MHEKIEHDKYTSLSGDDFYVIESVIEKKEENDKKLFLIKWAGFTSDESTWEGEDSVPRFIQTYYEDERNMGKPLPKPVVKHTKKIGNTVYHYLKWGVQKGGQWLDEDFFKVVTEDGEVSTMAANPEVSCGTRKSRDKRVKRHTVGLFVVAYPCGVVVVCDELFGSESISQVGQSNYRICTFKSISFSINRCTAFSSTSLRASPTRLGSGI